MYFGVDFDTNALTCSTNIDKHLDGTDKNKRREVAKRKNKGGLYNRWNVEGQTDKDIETEKTANNNRYSWKNS